MAALRIYSQPPNDGGKLIGTHDGHFHCDEALACALLHMTEEFKDAGICRSRNKEYLDLCNIVVDVGAEYDPARCRFDHHQLSFTGTMTTTEAEYKTKLSSAGLVYKHYGREVVAKLCGGLQDSDVDIIYDRVYKNFIEHIDGIDNGVEEFSLSQADTDVALKQNYRVTTTLSARAGRFNPSWNDPQSSELENECFAKAVKLTGDEFVESVVGYCKSWMPARSIVQKAVDSRFDVHASGRIMRLECPCPWQEHLFDIEAKMNIEGEIFYVLYPDGKGPWRVQCVGVKGTKFQNRKSLEFKGLRDAELSTASGIPDCIFVHASGFIGGNKTEAGALALAVHSLQA
uniref:Metal-dependent protein hydrolase n=1 Tax=Eutreptiella gymnastica TaxID=73025 RepID=A0A7S1NCZ5_9EUGL